MKRWLTFAVCLVLSALPAAAVGKGLLELDGKPAQLQRDKSTELFAFLFVRTECPVSNAYAPEIQRLAKEFSNRGVTFELVYPDADDSADAIRHHLQDFGYHLPALRDPRHEFAIRAKVRVTPEAAIFNAQGTLLYHGRIDDRYVDFGKAKASPAHRELAEAITLLLANKPAPPPGGPAVGCIIE